MIERKDAERGLRYTFAKAWKRLLPFFVSALLMAAGIALSLGASFPTTTRVAMSVYQGVAPPGDSLLPLNQTEHSFAIFRSDLPCPLIVYPLTGPEHQLYLENGALPSQALHCDNPSLVKAQATTQLLFRNVDPLESFEYTVDGEFSRAVLPYAWMAIPGLVLLILGVIPLMVMLMLRGISRLGEGVGEEVDKAPRGKK